MSIPRPREEASPHLKRHDDSINLSEHTLPGLDAEPDSRPALPPDVVEFGYLETATETGPLAIDTAALTTISTTTRVTALSVAPTTTDLPATATESLIDDEPVNITVPADPVASAAQQQADQSNYSGMQWAVGAGIGGLILGLILGYAFGWICWRRQRKRDNGGTVQNKHRGDIRVVHTRSEQSSEDAHIISVGLGERVRKSVQYAWSQRRGQTENDVGRPIAESTVLGQAELGTQQRVEDPVSYKSESFNQEQDYHSRRSSHALPEGPMSSATREVTRRSSHSNKATKRQQNLSEEPAVYQGPGLPDVPQRLNRIRYVEPTEPFTRDTQMTEGSHYSSLRNTVPNGRYTSLGFNLQDHGGSHHP